jgi:uncharacterized protein YidB (DUF937 family)
MPTSRMTFIVKDIVAGQVPIPPQGYKALKGSGVLGSSPAEPVRAPAGPPPSNPTQAAGEGSDWLSGLEKMIAGGSAGSILSRGLGELVKKFQQTGQGQVAQSWIGTGSNRAVAPEVRRLNCVRAQ